MRRSLLVLVLLASTLLTAAQEKLKELTLKDAITKAARIRKAGMDFATCLGPNPETTIQWTAALGRAYVWASVSGTDFDTFCRQVSIQTSIAATWGIQVGLHNHMGTLIETQPQVEAFLERCPQTGLILDTAHLAAAGGDPVAMVKKYGNRLVAVHLKDWLLLKPDIPMERWYDRGRFCELGAGNIGLDNRAVLQALKQVGYNRWIFVEHDTHLQDPLKDLAVSLAYIRSA